MDNKPNNSSHIIEQISAYLDGALDDATSDEVQVHIEGCALCRAEYTEVRATRQLLRAVITVPPPRAFTLTEEMVGRRRTWDWGQLLVPRNVPRLISGSAVAFALVVLLFVVDLSNVGTSQDVLRTASAPVQKQAAPTGPASAQGDVSSTPEDSLNLGAGGGVIEGTPGVVLPAVPMPTSLSENSALAQPTSLAQATTTAVLSALSALPTQPLPPVEPRTSSGTSEQDQTPGAVSSDATPPTSGYSAQPTILAVDRAFTAEASSPPPEGGRVLLFSIEGLLVVLGAVLAVGAVFAARR